MTTAIRYHSRTGNTKKLAEAAAQVLGVPAETVDTPLEGEVDILFLCSAVYGAGVDDKIKAFISTLDKGKVKTVVNLSTAALLPSTYSQVGKLLAEKGIPLDKREFHCRGKFAILHSSRPNERDLENVKQFVQSVIKDEKGA